MHIVIASINNKEELGTEILFMDNKMSLSTFCGIKQHKCSGTCVCLCSSKI